MGWIPGWGKRIKLTIDQTKVDTANQSNFPVLVYLSAASGITSADLSCIFDELDYPSVDDDFTGVNGSAPNTDLWIENDSSNSLDIQSNKLHFSSSGAANVISAVDSKFTLTGDFDVQIDFDITTITAPSSSASYGAAVYIIFDGGSWVYHSKGKSSDGILRFYPNSSAGGSTAVADSDMSGKLRVTRVGSVIKLYYWKNSQWEWDGNAAGLTSSLSTSADVSSITLRFNQDFDGTVISDIDNFTINSGSIIWPQGTHPNRKKIAVTTSDGTTQCYVEIERWDDANEKAWLWGKVPSVAYNADTDLYIYYDVDHADNDSYVGDTTDAVTHNIWDSNFICVLHMAQDPSGGSGCIKDSTSNANDGTPGGSMTTADLVDALVGKGIDYDGSDDLIQVSNTSDFQINGNFTIEFVYKKQTGGHATYPGIFDKGNWKTAVADNGWGISYDVSGDKFLFIKSNQVFDFAAPVGSSLVDVALTYDGSDMRSYKAGALTDGPTAKSYTSDTNTDDFYMGRNPDGNMGAHVLDEIRLSKTNRSTPWIKATYHSNSDTLVTFGSEEIAAADLFDGKCCISPTVDNFDGKAQVKNVATDVFDGKGIIALAAEDNFDGEAKIKDVTTINFDGNTAIKNLATDFFDGKLWLYPARDFFDGKIWIKELIEGSIELPCLDILGNTGAIGDVTLPFFEVLGEVSVGIDAQGNITLPGLGVAGFTGARCNYNLPSLGVSGTSVVGILASGDVVLPIFNVEGQSFTDALVNGAITLPALTVVASSIAGALCVGEVKLPSLGVSATAKVGAVCIGAVTLPCLIIEGTSGHVPIGDGDVILPMLQVYSTASILADPRDGCHILRHHRWR